VIVQINQSLKKLNTFGIDQKASRLIWAQSKEEIENYLLHHGAPALVLGGGSNMLLTKDVEGDVLKVDIHGREVVFEDDDYIHISFGAGENWHEAVLWTLMQGFGGLENLSLIPGNCGTAPVQNIGAYGVELQDVFVSCEGILIADGSPFKLSKEDVRFGYRNSIFKNEWKGKTVITQVTLQLTKRNHRIIADYGAIKSELDKIDVSEPTPKQISDVVVAIRKSKLPDPSKIGNSGSFFKNPIVTEVQATELIKNYPGIPTYTAENGKKIAAGWIIEQCGWKGFRKKDAGVHKKQALVLVNYGNATGSEIHALSQRIIEDVYTRFGIQLEPEVNLI
jgi:UDP-N-acetylmuramate dehydrogenase